ncbi:cobalamin-independent methionine synthase II family protein [Corynebacterium flavescens]|nr:cobalamin-independent methionine synthase II family protein [Corynebacterium flavescens]APT87521.1 methionine synthase [Corynebacterium flavescens]KAA8720333.1 cobalamin-independent methionine synthase II family protein [Corynebacterium flavescens]MDN6099678.1 cobalamin-independent methionine synthase II family protein [Corynebacterium flavescens]
MADRILTTHVGSLPRTPEILEANRSVAAGEITQEEFREIQKENVEWVVKKQREIGIDIVNDGEYGHPASGPDDMGSWWSYSFSRLGGLKLGAADEENPEREIVLNPAGDPESPGNRVHIGRVASFDTRRDWQLFHDLYADAASGAAPAVQGRGAQAPYIGAPLTYTGQELVKRDAHLLREAMRAARAEQGFVASISPGMAADIGNRFYETEEELLGAAADAMGQEYKAIADAGLTVQIDAPELADVWDRINPEPNVADFQAFISRRVDAINRALRDVPREQARLHICWGSWHGPHSTDVPFELIVDECLRANVSGFSFENSTGRHAHEWRVWQNRSLPKETVIYPGVVAHSTNILEHPRAVADRIIKFADLVGPENVIASTDCGLGGRLNGTLAWAKLESLVEGARIASAELF